MVNGAIWRTFMREHSKFGKYFLEHPFLLVFGLFKKYARQELKMFCCKYF